MKRFIPSKLDLEIGTHPDGSLGPMSCCALRLKRRRKRKAARRLDRRTSRISRKLRRLLPGMQKDLADLIFRDSFLPALLTP